MKSEVQHHPCKCLFTVGSEEVQIMISHYSKINKILQINPVVYSKRYYPEMGQRLFILIKLLCFTNGKNTTVPLIFQTTSIPGLLDINDLRYHINDDLISSIAITSFLRNLANHASNVNHVDNVNDNF